MKYLVAFMLASLFILSGSLFTTAANTSAAQKSKYPINQPDLSATRHLKSIVLGAGCFWGAEKRYSAIDGVVDAVSGYADGRGVSPDYRSIIQHKNKFNPQNFAEVVKVTYNTSIVSTQQILQNYFEGHDPTQLNRQGNDIGTQYRSTILFEDDQQKNIADKVKAHYQSLLKKASYGKIVTQIKQLDHFYPAEEYHQDYLVKNPNGYCPDHSTGVKFDPSARRVAKVDNGQLKQGKQILVIEAEGYCPYCEKFKADVAKDYRGNIKINYRLATQLEGLEIKIPTWATPTIIFLDNGKEVFARQGYMSPKEFYQALALFKLGKSEAYNVAFKQGTDGRFCKQYEIFKHTPDGVFVDKLSGAPLFDTNDRFNSGTGWLSFTKPVDNSTVTRDDHSFGMDRIEILSKSSGIHLGHVFPDGPNGHDRYCINATVLDFIPRAEI